ncbi:MAG: Gldg family protein [Myxococcota bacterium]
MTILTTSGVLAGLFFLFLGRQVFHFNVAGDVLTGLGMILVVAAIGGRVFLRTKASDTGKQAELPILYSYGGVLLALLLYWLATDWGTELTGADPEGRMIGVLVVAWPAILTISLMALIFMEFTYLGMPVADAVDTRRLRKAAFHGLSIAFALVFVAGANFVAHTKDVSEDLSYFKTTRPSEGTLQMVGALDEPLEILLVYPSTNPVVARLRPYFDEVAAASDQVTVKVRDQALIPEIARAQRINDNGQIVLLQGEGESQRGEKFSVNQDLVAARDDLATLDGRFRRAFAALTTRPQELYLTSGHGERAESGSDGDDRGERLRDFAEALRQSNITMQTLGLAQGLAERVPEGAPAVAVIGPRQPFLPEETQSLLDYVQSGGRVALFIEPESEHGLTPFLHGVGLDLRPGILASPTRYMRRTGTAADKGIIRTNTYSSHATVTLAMRNVARGVASIFIQGGALERRNDVPEGVNITFPLTASGDYFLDANGNYEQDDGEATGRMNLMAAVTVPNEGGREGRVVVIADGDFITDQIIRNPGNGLLLTDMMEWLIGQERIVGNVTREDDERIERSADEDSLWFWGTSFLVPLPVLALGIFIPLRRRSRRRDDHRDRNQRDMKKKKDGPGKDPAKDRKDDGKDDTRASTPKAKAASEPPPAKEESSEDSDSDSAKAKDSDAGSDDASSEHGSDEDTSDEASSNEERSGDASDQEDGSDDGASDDAASVSSEDDSDEDGSNKDGSNKDDSNEDDSNEDGSDEDGSDDPNADSESEEEEKGT